MFFIFIYKTCPYDTESQLMPGNDSISEKHTRNQDHLFRISYTPQSIELLRGGREQTFKVLQVTLKQIKS